MNIKFEKSIGRLSFFVPSTEHQNCLDKFLGFVVICKYCTEGIMANMDESAVTFLMNRKKA